MPFQKIEFSSHVLGWYIILYWFKWCWNHKRIFSRRKDTYNYESIIKNYISQQIFVKSWPSHKSNYNNKKVLFFLETKRPKHFIKIKSLLVCFCIPHIAHIQLPGTLVYLLNVHCAAWFYQFFKKKNLDDNFFSSLFLWF